MFKKQYLSKRLVCCLALALIAAPMTGTLAAQEATKPSTAEPDEESLDVRLARAHLKLAMADLRRAAELNRQFPGSVPTTAMENYRKHVEVDKEQLAQSLKGGDGHVHAIHRRAAEITVKIAEDDLARKQQILEKVPSAFTELDVERAKAAVEVARLHKLRTDSQESSLSSLSYLQWQIEQLRNDLLELRVRVETQRDH